MKPSEKKDARASLSTASKQEQTAQLFALVWEAIDNSFPAGRIECLLFFWEFSRLLCHDRVCLVRLNKNCGSSSSGALLHFRTGYYEIRFPLGREAPLVATAVSDLVTSLVGHRSSTKEKRIAGLSRRQFEWIRQRACIYKAEWERHLRSCLFSRCVLLLGLGSVSTWIQGWFSRR